MLPNSLVTWFPGPCNKNPPPNSESGAKAVSRKEEKRVEQLRRLLQHCYTSDYLIPTSLAKSESKFEHNNLCHTAFWLPWKMPRIVHWYHIHDLLVAPVLQRQPGTHVPSAEEQAETEQVLVEHIDRPAEIIGLDPEVVRRRVKLLKHFSSNSPQYRAHGYWSASEIIELAGKRRYHELAQKIVRDREMTLRLLIMGMTVKEKESGRKLCLYEVLQASLKDIQDRIFVPLRSDDDYTLVPLVQIKSRPLPSSDRSKKPGAIKKPGTPKAAASELSPAGSDLKSQGLLRSGIFGNPRLYRRDILRRDLKF